ncbi:hypothetical protein BIFCAT_00004 [Bifidobacterium catenulatum DSM 16992 = JCM 1194 = LMG 11043]|uniref:Uncharacterized protein n=1 Tax=Bifidobacterium catenulatum DSM 16992 = JCM 1194 = LMG 11043 TaxID=566552 RepID=B6XS56_9BIFI|nr:hypothetical protein BIFCAT_00004 [Bifidobacterium catenulatum DSM 16992 = JCM 1194 = LMG 11043]
MKKCLHFWKSCDAGQRYAISGFDEGIGACMSFGYENQGGGRPCCKSTWLTS